MDFCGMGPRYLYGIGPMDLGTASGRDGRQETGTKGRKDGANADGGAENGTNGCNGDEGRVGNGDGAAVTGDVDTAAGDEDSAAAICNADGTEAVGRNAEGTKAGEVATKIGDGEVEATKEGYGDKLGQQGKLVNWCVAAVLVSVATGCARPGSWACRTSRRKRTRSRSGRGSVGPDLDKWLVALMVLLVASSDMTTQLIKGVQLVSSLAARTAPIRSVHNRRGVRRRPMTIGRYLGGTYMVLRVRIRMLLGSVVASNGPINSAVGLAASNSSMRARVAGTV